jgi:hypothetical protein
LTQSIWLSQAVAVVVVVAVVLVDIAQAHNR